MEDQIDRSMLQMVNVELYKIEVDISHMEKCRTDLLVIKDEVIGRIALAESIDIEHEFENLDN